MDEERIAEACVELDKKIISEGLCNESGSTGELFLGSLRVQFPRFFWTASAVGNLARLSSAKTRRRFPGTSSSDDCNGVLSGGCCAISAAMLLIERDMLTDDTFSLHSIYVGTLMLAWSNATSVCPLFSAS